MRFALLMGLAFVFTHSALLSFLVVALIIGGWIAAKNLWSAR